MFIGPKQSYEDTIYFTAHLMPIYPSSIGTHHDGNGNGCASGALYLMAPRLPVITDPALRNNPFTFSTCSQQAITQYLASLGRLVPLSM